MAGVAFKTEKEYQAWLARNPQVAPRVRAEPPIERPRTTPLPVALATSEGVRVADALAPRRRVLPTRAGFDRFMAWFFVAAVGVSTLGVVACTSAILALEYVR